MDIAIAICNPSTTIVMDIDIAITITTIVIIVITIIIISSSGTRSSSSSGTKVFLPTHSPNCPGYCAASCEHHANIASPDTFRFRHMSLLQKASMLPPRTPGNGHLHASFPHVQTPHVQAAQVPTLRCIGTHTHTRARANTHTQPAKWATGQYHVSHHSSTCTLIPSHVLTTSQQQRPKCGSPLACKHLFLRALGQRIKKLLIRVAPRSTHNPSLQVSLIQFEISTIALANFQC